MSVQEAQRIQYPISYQRNAVESNYTHTSPTIIEYRPRRWSQTVAAATIVGGLLSFAAVIIAALIAELHSSSVTKDTRGLDSINVNVSNLCQNAADNYDKASKIDASYRIEALQYHIDHFSGCGYEKLASILIEQTQSAMRSQPAYTASDESSLTRDDSSSIGVLRANMYYELHDQIVTIKVKLNATTKIKVVAGTVQLIQDNKLYHTRRSEGEDIVIFSPRGLSAWALKVVSAKAIIQIYDVSDGDHREET